MQYTGIGHRGGVFHLRGITVQVQRGPHVSSNIILCSKEGLVVTSCTPTLLCRILIYYNIIHCYIIMHIPYSLAVTPPSLLSKGKKTVKRYSISLTRPPLPTALTCSTTMLLSFYDHVRLFLCQWLPSVILDYNNNICVT